MDYSSWWKGKTIQANRHPIHRHGSYRFGKREFAMMKDGVYLVNTSRGGGIDEAIFLDALRTGKIACAGIGVLANELDNKIDEDPLVRHARERDNLIITPHLGGCSFDAQEKAYRHTARKLVDFLTRG